MPESIEVFAVWTRGIQGDNKEEAKKMIKQLDAPNVQHYWDPGQNVGSVYSKKFNWSDTLAWDVYLFFGPETRWNELAKPPSAKIWFHQRSSVENHKNRYLTEQKIRTLLDKMVKKAFRAKEDN